MDVFVGAAVLLVVTASLYLWKKRSTANLPPGPTGLPIIGYLHKLGGKSLHLIMHDLAAKYGSIFSLRLGSRLAVVLSSRDVIYEAYVKNAKVFAGRPNFVTFEATNHSATGISLCSYDNTYVYNRKNTMKAIHRLCANKALLDKICQNEIQKLLSLFDKYDLEQTVFDVTAEFKKIVPGMFLAIMFGNRFLYDDKDFIDIVYWFNKWFENAEADNPADFMTFLKYFPNERLNTISECGKAFEVFAMKMIDEYQDKKADTGLIYSFFQYFGNTHDLSYQEKLNFARVVADLCGGGFDTVASTLAWAPLYFSEKPHILKKCRKELSSAFNDNILSAESKDSVPYFCATLYDIFRHSTVGPLGLPRCTMEEVKFQSDTIPKNTMVFANLWACNHDPKEWKETEFLYPENFLTDDGLLDNEAIKKLMTFSSGVRRCPGEKLAFVKSFMILGTMIQKYDFIIEQKPEDMLPMRGVTLKPKFYTMSLRPINS